MLFSLIADTKADLDPRTIFIRLVTIKQSEFFCVVQSCVYLWQITPDKVNSVSRLPITREINM